MRAGPGFLCAATTVVAVDAHVLGVVFGLLVRTLFADADGLDHLELHSATAFVALGKFLLHPLLVTAVFRNLLTVH